MVQVSWIDARAFCAWLTKKLAGSAANGQARLPTEAEWEYAARSSEGRTYAWGDEKPTNDRANFGGIVGDTTPVGSYGKGATPEGVHDLAGNVWEWCGDWFGDYGERLQKKESIHENPTGASTGREKVIRGGSWHSDPHRLRAAARDVNPPEHRHSRIGIRVVWSSSGGLA